MMVDTALEITVNDGEYRLDSRVLAKRLGYEHRALVRFIQRHKPGLERKSFLRQFDAKTKKDEKRWSRYAREVLGIPNDERRKYPHLCQDNRTEHVWAYPLCYVDLFGKWLWVVYFPEQFPAYTRYRAHSIGVPAPERTARKQLAAPANQLTLFAEPG